MENAYGIGVKNRYDLFLNEEEDPLDILRAQEEEREKTKKDKPKEAKPKGGVKLPVAANTKQSAPTPATTTTTANTKKTTSKDTTTTRNAEPTTTGGETRTRSTKPPGGDRGGRFGPREDQKDIDERKNRRNREERPQNTSSEFRERAGDGEMRRGRGGPRGGPGAGRSRGRGRGGFDGRGKREFDRQSGSDKSVKPTEKREGGGAHNWGTVKDDIDGDSFNLQTSGTEEHVEVAERSGDEETPVESTEPKSGDDEQTLTADEENKDPAEDAKEMTLDEWKKEQEVKRSVPKFNLRKPGEGEDGGQWKKLYVLKKKEKENSDDEDEETDEDEDDFVRKGRQKQLVDIEINFADSRRSRGGRGGRGTRGGMGGGPRGGRGRGGGGGRDESGNFSGGEGGGGGAPRGEREDRGERGGRPYRGRDREDGGGRGPKGGKNQQSAPKVDDWNDFPSLIAA